MKRIKSLGITIVVVLVLVAMQPFLWRLVRSTTVRLQDKRSQVQQVAELKSRVKAIEDNIEQQRGFLDQLTVAVPLDRTIQVLERLEDVAGQVGVVVDVVSIVEGEQLTAGRGGSVPVFPLIVSGSVTGRPSQLLGYIEAMEHVQELVQVKSFVMSLGDGGMFSLDMAVIFYLQK